MNNWKKKQFSKNAVIPLPSSWGKNEITELTREERQKFNKTGKYAENGRNDNIIVSKSRNMGLSNATKGYYNYITSQKSIPYANTSFYREFNQHCYETGNKINNMENEELNNELEAHIYQKIESLYPEFLSGAEQGGISNIIDARRYIASRRDPEPEVVPNHIRDYVERTHGSVTGYKPIEEVKSDITTIKVKRLTFEARLPKRMNATDAGWDCYADNVREDYSQVTYGLGIAVEIPVGYCLLIYPRSSVRNYDLIMSNCVAVIDSGFRGEISVVFNKKYEGTCDDGSYRSAKYKVGDRVCQMVLYKLPEVEFVEVQELDETNDRKGGYGSTGER